MHSAQLPFSAGVDLSHPDVTASQADLLTDPQTSGGLLVSCTRAAAKEVLAIFQRHGFGQARVIGEAQAAGAGARLTVRT